MGIKKISEIVKLLQKYKYVVVAIAVGFFLLILPYGEEKNVEEKAKEESFDVKKFEQKLERALSECDGVGRCRVVLSVESGGELVYEKEMRKNLKENENGTTLQSDTDTKPSIISEGAGKQTPLIVKERYPEFRGAVVICDGADKTMVRNEVGACIAALTGLRSDKISIIKMKK